MTATITDAALLNQSAELLEATCAAMARVSYDLCTGLWDDDTDAREQACAFLEDARRFCDGLLRAWPESIAV